VAAAAFGQHRRHPSGCNGRFCDTGATADEESDEATIFDTEIMMGCIDLATGSLPKFDRELIRAYRMGLKTQEIAEIIEVDPKEVQDKLRIVKAKLKRLIKVTEP
jgi:DNA-directed RNA polymerase specialized sigma24 family protein